MLCPDSCFHYNFPQKSVCTISTSPSSRLEDHNLFKGCQKKKSLKDSKIPQKTQRKLPKDFHDLIQKEKKLHRTRQTVAAFTLNKYSGFRTSTVNCIYK